MHYISHLLHTKIDIKVKFSRFFSYLSSMLYMQVYNKQCGPGSTLFVKQASKAFQWLTKQTIFVEFGA